MKNVQILYCPSARGTGVGYLTDTPANRAAGNISYYYFSFDQVPSAATPPPKPGNGWITWVCTFFIPSRTSWGDNPRAMSEMFDTDYWMACDWFCKPSKKRIHGGPYGSMNVLYVDGHAKYFTKQATLGFK